MVGMRALDRDGALGLNGCSGHRIQKSLQKVIENGNENAYNTSGWYGLDRPGVPRLTLTGIRMGRRAVPCGWVDLVWGMGKGWSRFTALPTDHHPAAPGIPRCVVESVRCGYQCLVSHQHPGGAQETVDPPGCLHRGGDRELCFSGAGTAVLGEGIHRSQGEEGLPFRAVPVPCYTCTRRTPQTPGRSTRCAPSGSVPPRGERAAPWSGIGTIRTGRVPMARRSLRRTGCGSGAAVPGEEKTAEGQPAPWDFPCPIILPDRSPLLRRHGGEGPVWDDGKVDGDGIGGVSGRMQRRRPTDH